MKANPQQMHVAMFHEYATDVIPTYLWETFGTRFPSKVIRLMIKVTSFELRHQAMDNIRLLPVVKLKSREEEMFGEKSVDFFANKSWVDDRFNIEACFEKWKEGEIQLDSYEVTSS
jgi:hypothetical protein